MLSSMPKHGKRAIALTTAFSVLSFVPAFAAVPPDAGSTIGTMRDSKVIVPGKVAPSIETGTKKNKVTQQDQGPKIHVAGIHIAGQDVYSEEVLLALVKDGVGKDLTMPELKNLAERVTKYLQDQGYLVANTYIPVQKNQGGVMEFKVVLGKYGTIDVQNKSQMSTEKVSSFLKNIKSGQYVKKDSLERALLIMNDISGISIKANLAPGKTQGTTDLKVEVKDTQQFTGTISADNYGNSYTGNDRSNISLVLHDASGVGDEVMISGISAGSQMSNFGASYKIPIGTQGGQLGVEYAHTHYYLGDKFADLGAKGNANTSSISYTHPIKRSRDFNLYGRIGYDQKTLEDHIDTLLDADESGNPYVSMKKDKLYHIGLVGSQRDAGGNGVTSFALTQYAGNLSINTPSILTYDAYYAKTNGHFNKTNLNVQRQKYMTKRLSYSLSLNAQQASKNLDSSEKMFLGGANGVRAYPNGDASGDSGAIITGEVHFDMPSPLFQLAAFIDNGRVSANQNPWLATSNKTVLTGAGIGLIWNRQNDYSVRIDCAWRLTNALYGDNARNGRVWLQGIKHF